MPRYMNVLDTIGRTPMLHLRQLGNGGIFAKAEFLNPGGSIKDRVALHILEESEKSGALKPGQVIAEATSGNTGIGFAMVGIRKGYHVIIVMPENMSDERKKIIRALGADLVLTPADESINGSIKKLEELASADSNIFVPGQFTNPLNPEAHYLHTAAEIWEQMEGKVDAFVAGIGSGGTLGGVGRFLKEKDKRIHLVAVEPANAAALLGQEPGLHQIQGIGDGFVPPVLDTSLVDEVITVSDEEAIGTTRKLTVSEGTLAGTSSGANVWAALKVSQELGSSARVVTVLPDRAERYFSTALI